MPERLVVLYLENEISATDFFFRFMYGQSLILKSKYEFLNLAIHLNLSLTSSLNRNFPANVVSTVIFAHFSSKGHNSIMNG